MMVYVYVYYRRDVLIEKVVKRRVCTGCSKIYNLADIKLGTMRMPPMPPKVAGVCDDCHGRVVQRNDDALVRLRCPRAFPFLNVCLRLSFLSACTITTRNTNR